MLFWFFFFSSRRRHTRLTCDWSSDVCSSDLAAWLDPQQRLLLELAWEAMESGGQVPSRLARSDCAVFVGISGVDYGMRAMDDSAALTAHSMTGNTLSIAANRLSYVFDLHGPSVA